MPIKHHRTVDRVVQILEFVATRPGGATLTEISRALEAPVSSIQGFINGLVATGYVDEENRRYLLGAGPYILTLRANRMPARTVRQADLEELGETTRCSVLLGVRLGWNVVYVGNYGDSPHLAYLSRTRVRRPMLSTVGGRALLASLDVDQLNEFLAEQEDQAEVRAFLSDVDEIRRTGFAVNLFSEYSKSTTLARPVRDRTGEVVATIVLGGPREDLEPRLDEVKAIVTARTDEWATRG